MPALRTRALAGWAMAAVALAAAGSVHATSTIRSNYTFPSGFSGFRLDGLAGGIDPCWLIGFNTHSGAGAATLLSLADPTNPVFTNPSNGGAFDFIVSLAELGDGSVVPANPLQPPDARGFTSYGFTAFDDNNRPHDVVVTLQFGGSPIDSFTWGAFVPQPDPPGRWLAGSVAFAGDPFMSLHVTLDGHIATFSPEEGVPEPATWGLMLLGVFGVGRALRSRRAATLAA